MATARAGNTSGWVQVAQLPPSNPQNTDRIMITSRFRHQFFNGAVTPDRGINADYTREREIYDRWGQAMELPPSGGGPPASISYGSSEVLL